MILLQALSGTVALCYVILWVVFAVYFLIGVPKLTGFLMKIIWKTRGKEEYLKNKTPYYKDPLWFFPCLILSITVLCYIFYLLASLLAL